MEGPIARWYSRTTGRDMEQYRRLAATLAGRLGPGAEVLEVAPGPGYLAVELAGLGSFRVTGLDISRTFVGIATENAARAGVAVEFVQGDVAAMPFGPDSFDLAVCRAAFKNFPEPVRALDRANARVSQILVLQGFAI
jgi:ubiquinone/menaquinone biosynthesis C-methylase UbiE